MKRSVPASPGEQHFPRSNGPIVSSGGAAACADVRAGLRPFVVALLFSIVVHAGALVLLAARVRPLPLYEISLYDGRGGGAEGAAAGAAGVVGTPPAIAPEERPVAPERLAPTNTRRSPQRPRTTATPVRLAAPVPAPPVRGDAPPGESTTARSGTAGGVAGAGTAAGAMAGGGGVVGDAGGGGDLRAACIACPPPTYPAQARRRGWKGVVDLRLRIDAAGRVGDVEVARASGFPVLDDAAVRAARRSRFRLPARHRDDDDGGVWGRIRYRFEIEG
jgi:protein TonB